jgi:pyridoxamine 5'-phosphate oxidase
MPGRFELEKKIAVFTAKFGIGAVPRPLHWSGYRLLPDNLEFWDDEKFRLHERIVYTKTENLWVTDRLFP